jgi:hypothetical protein
METPSDTETQCGLSDGGSFDEHFCYLVSQGFNISDEQEYTELADNPQFRCIHCDLEAKRDESLCVPVPLRR